MVCISEALITYISEFKHLLSYLFPAYVMEIEIHNGNLDTDNMDFIIINLYGQEKDIKCKQTVYDIEYGYYNGLGNGVETTKIKAYNDILDIMKNGGYNG